MEKVKLILQNALTRILRLIKIFAKKVWKTKEQDGYMLSTPNRRTKAGREMENFLANFKRTDCWE